MICKWCNGSGSIAVEQGCSLRYRCPDCQGNGEVTPTDILPEDIWDAPEPELLTEAIL